MNELTDFYFQTSGPSSVNKVDDCTYSVNWETAFACPEEMTSQGSDDATCSISDPITGHTYDLLPLLSNKAYVVNNTGRIFKVVYICISVCTGTSIAFSETGEALGGIILCMIH